MGRTAAELRELLAPSPWRLAGGLPELLIDCVRARLFAKLLYRSGDRDGAMEALENALAHPLFPELSALVRGILMRERGIVHTFCEHPVAARADLQEALRLFKSVGYKPGMVRATTPGALAPLHRCAGGRGRPQLRAQHPPRALRRPRRARDEGRDGRPRVEARRPLLRPR